MAQAQEIEFKQLIDAETYQTIRTAYFKTQQPFTQKNHYIDTPDLQIAQHKMALRIREKDDGLELTLKVPAKIGLTEYNSPISILPTQQIPSSELPHDVVTILKQHDINISNLKILGALETKRMETQLENGLLVLDHSLYLGTEDYELEFEVNDYDRGLVAFQAILDQFHLTHNPPKNKVQRFFERQAELKEDEIE
ncbi:CYTH domain-containing protein [Staphylococcus canis]|uniref:CYTH domain-containing protein n=1 Tax=Staphylococcus canis TaxID=2724942 RepID=A0ABS0T970_9STAP|nr:CYTH domain-containing protein [Staphylococcus canis]MBI5975271.1 CYTH domain-containing protein [Staphylococcus canis]